VENTLDKLGRQLIDTPIAKSIALMTMALEHVHPESQIMVRT